MKPEILVGCAVLFAHLGTDNRNPTTRVLVVFGVSGLFAVPLLRG